jgi:multidrug efflux system membrane fusion protein
MALLAHKRIRIHSSRVVGLAIAAASALTGCSRGDAAATQTSGGRGGGQQATVPVAVALVEQRAVPLELRAIGTAQAYSVVAIRAQTTGELTSVNFKEGDDVRKGQVLFTLDRRPLEAALQTAEGNLARDTAQAANAATSARRYQDLQARGIATKEQVDESTTTAAALAATLEADRGALANARVQLQYATIAAPISGRTGQLMVHPGNLVRANDATPLVTINQVSPIYVAFGVPEGRLDDLKRYLAKGTLHVEATPPGASDPGSPGRITFIDNGVDPMTGMITVKVEFANRDHRLWPGRFVNVLVTLTTDPKAIVVPAVAVQSGQLGDYVFVVKTDRSVEYRKVTIERTVGSNTVIREGLVPGETVVTDGQLRLTAGTHVSVKTGEGAGGTP